MIIKNYITINPYSRPGKKLEAIKGIIIHYLANPNSTAMENRNYFNNLKNQKPKSITGKDPTYASSHEIIDLNGDIILCVPENEKTHNCGSKTYTDKAKSVFGVKPNSLTYSIECCHIDSAGKFSVATYKSLVNRCIYLCKKFGLSSNNLWTHKEVVGWKNCPLWFITHPEEWIAFKKEVQRGLEGRDMDWKEMLGEVLDNPDKMIKGVETIVNMVKAIGDSGDLEQLQYLPLVFEKLYNRNSNVK